MADLPAGAQRGSLSEVLNVSCDGSNDYLVDVNICRLFKGIADGTRDRIWSKSRFERRLQHGRNLGNGHVMAEFGSSGAGRDQRQTD